LDLLEMQGLTNEKPLFSHTCNLAEDSRLPPLLRRVG
jgi:hypothetical protein